MVTLQSKFGGNKTFAVHRVVVVGGGTQDTLNAERASGFGLRVSFDEVRWVIGRRAESVTVKAATLSIVGCSSKGVDDAAPAPRSGIGRTGDGIVSSNDCRESTSCSASPASACTRHTSAVTSEALESPVRRDIAERRV